MRSDYESRHTSSGKRNSASSRRKKPRGSGFVIGIGLFLIIAALIVLGVVWFGILKPSLAADNTVRPEPASTPEAEAVVPSTPEPAPEPTPEPTPVPELVYSSSSSVVSNGDYLTDGSFEGVTFRNPSVLQLSDGRSLSIEGEEILLASGGQQTPVSCEGTPGSLLFLGNGRAAVLSWVENSRKLFLLNEDLTAAEKELALPESASCLADGNSNDLFYFSDGIELYAVKSEDSVPVPVLNWTAVNISGSRISNILAEEDGSFRCLSNVWQDDSFQYATSLITVTGTPEASSSRKQELVLLSVNPVESLQDAIVSFNLSQDSTVLLLKSFDPASDDSETVSFLRRYIQDELDGVYPDIMDLTGLPYEALASSGIFEDLYPLLDADGELSRSSFVPQVLSAMEINGKLYGSCSGFTLGTVVGPARLLGNMNSWTIRDYNSITSTMGEGTYAFGALDTQSNVLYDLLGIQLHRFIDWQNLTCSFDNADFISILELIRRLPSDYLDTVDTEQIQKNIQLFLRTTIYEANDLSTAGSCFASPVYIGLPVIEGSGNVLNLQRGFAVTSSCSDKQAAWQFIRSTLTAAAQAGSWVFPSNQEAFEAYIASAGENASVLRNLLSNSAGNSADPAIHSLILENISGYLKGTESSSAAASKVQSAVSGYLSSLKN